MKGQICLVTGANSGIGKVTALELAKLGATVVMVCRDKYRGEIAREEIKTTSQNESVDLMLADLSSQASIRSLAADFQSKYQQLNVLVNNAGAMFTRRQVSVDGLELTFALNHLGYFLLTNLLLDVLKASPSARVVNVASAAHWGRHIDFDDLQSTRGYRFMEVYGRSKLANILFTFELARRLRGTSVTANCLHPGFVATNMAKNNGFLFRLGTTLARPFARTPEKGAETVVYLATSPEVANSTGKYYVDKRIARTSPAANDKDAALRLWQASLELNGLS